MCGILEGIVPGRPCRDNIEAGRHNTKHTAYETSSKSFMLTTSIVRHGVCKIQQIETAYKGQFAKDRVTIGRGSKSVYFTTTK